MRDFLSSATNVVSCGRHQVVKNGQNTFRLGGATSLTCLKYGFPNSADSLSLQPSPIPAGVWAEVSFSSAALLLRAIRSSCSEDRDAAGGLVGSGSGDFRFFWMILVYCAKHKAGKTRVTEVEDIRRHR